MTRLLDFVTCIGTTKPCVARQNSYTNPCMGMGKGQTALRKSVFSEDENLPVIRCAYTEDLDAIYALEYLVFGQDAYGPAKLRAFHARFGDLVLVACDVDGVIVGYAIGGGRANPVNEIKDSAWVNSLAVHPGRRGCGIAGMLLDTLLDAFVARGLCRAMVYTEEWRTPAIRLYRSRGFVPACDPHPSGLARVTLAASLICR